MKKRSLYSQLVNGTVLILGGVFLSRIFGFLYRFLLARYLGPDRYGLFSLGIMTTGILSIFTLFGLHEGTKRFIVMYREQRRPDKLKGLVLVSTLTVVSLSALIYLLFHSFAGEISATVFSKPELERILKIFSMAVLFNSLLILLQEVFVGFERPLLRALTEGFGLRFCPLICAVFVILAGGDLIEISKSYLIGLLIASALGYLALYLLLFREPAGNIIFDGRELYAYSFPLLFTGIVELLFQWTDIFLIGVYLPAAAAGIYSAVFTAASVMPSVNVAVSALFLPRTVRNFVKQDLAEMKNDFFKTQKNIFLLTLPLAMVFIVFPESVIHIAFGEAFLGGTWAMRILSVGIFAGICFCPGQSVLLAIGQTRRLLVVHATISVVNILLNIILIQKAGIEGAAFATAFCWFVKNAVIYKMVMGYFAGGFRQNISK